MASEHLRAAEHVAKASTTVETRAERHLCLRAAVSYAAVAQAAVAYAAALNTGPFIAR
jgi:hypothetical protein